MLTTKVSEVSSQVEPSGGDFATTRRADGGGSAGPVLHDDGRAEALLQAGLQEARHGVGRAAGGKRIDDPDHLGGDVWARAATGARIPAATIERLVSMCRLHPDDWSRRFRHFL